MVTTRRMNYQQRVQNSRRLRSGAFIPRVGVKQATVQLRQSAYRGSSPALNGDEGNSQPAYHSDSHRRQVEASSAIPSVQRNRNPLQRPSSSSRLARHEFGKKGTTRRNFRNASPATATSTAATSSVIAEHLPLDEEDVGTPVDDIWDHEAVYQERFCYQHGTEWLLGTLDRWMRPDDFKVRGVAAKLEARYQEYKSQPWGFQARSRASQAQCGGSLWTHVDVPINKAKLGDATIYLIRWKACWTPQTNFDDLEWVWESYQVHNLGLHSRCSDRLASTAPARAVKNKAIMAVVCLEDRL